MNNDLKLAMDALDKELKQKSLKLEIVICGAFALYMLGYIRSEHTLDV